jgi:hypothetical protein
MSVKAFHIALILIAVISIAIGYYHFAMICWIFFVIEYFHRKYGT